MRVARVLGCVAGLMASEAMAQGLAFKDLVIDGSFAEARKLRDFRCVPPKSHPADVSCTLDSRGNETIAGVPVLSLVMLGYGDLLDTIAVTMAAKDFAEVVNALKERYGTPTRDVPSVVTNRMGASYEQRIYEWRMAEGTISAHRYAGKLEHSTVMYSSVKSLQRWRERTNARTQERAKDL